MQLKVNDFVSLVDGYNVYKVIQKDLNFIELHCIEFYQAEELEKGIMCFNYDSLIWVNAEKVNLKKV